MFETNEFEMEGKEVREEGGSVVVVDEVAVV